MLKVYKVSFSTEQEKSGDTYVLAVSPSEAEWVVNEWIKSSNKIEMNILGIKVLSYLPKVKIETKTKGVLETLTAWNNLPGK